MHIAFIRYSSIILSAKSKKKKPPKMTTIAISVANQQELAKMRRGREPFDDILSRLVNSQFDVFIEFLLIDHELPSLHTAAFQCGTDTDSVFYFDGLHPPRPSTPQEINKFMKQPRPNFVLTSEEASYVREMIDNWFDDFMPEFMEKHKEKHSKYCALSDRIDKFLENQPK
jgi:hypothetical protein